MAINKTINKRTNTHGAMRNCIELLIAKLFEYESE